MVEQKRNPAHNVTRVSRLFVTLFAGAVLLIACSKSSPLELRDASEFNVADLNEQQVKARFGEPDRIQRIHKTSESIWGPAESFWELVPMNSNMVIWSYRVRGGDMELYFIEPDSIVRGVAFAPEGVVYESGAD